MDNKESVLNALEDFNRKPTHDAIPSILEDYFCSIAKTGETLFPWDKLKPLFMKKFEKCMEDFQAQSAYHEITPCASAIPVTFEEMKNQLLMSASCFTGAPFTIQRLCELITEPKRHYKRTDKFLRGIEKNVQVVTLVDPFGRKVTSDRISVNGVPESNGVPTTAPTTPPPSNIIPPSMHNWFTGSLTALWSSPTEENDSNVKTETKAEDKPEPKVNQEVKTDFETLEETGKTFTTLQPSYSALTVSGNITPVTATAELNQEKVAPNEDECRGREPHKVTVISWPTSDLERTDGPPKAKRKKLEHLLTHGSTDYPGVTDQSVESPASSDTQQSQTASSTGTTGSDTKVTVDSLTEPPEKSYPGLRDKEFETQSATKDASIEAENEPCATQERAPSGSPSSTDRAQHEPSESCHSSTDKPGNHVTTDAIQEPTEHALKMDKSDEIIPEPVTHEETANVTQQSSPNS